MTYGTRDILSEQRKEDKHKMPVTTRGKAIIEKSTGRTVAHGKTKASAKKAAHVRNMAHAVKKGYISKRSVSKYFGEKGY